MNFWRVNVDLHESETLLVTAVSESSPYFHDLYLQAATKDYHCKDTRKIRCMSSRSRRKVFIVKYAQSTLQKQAYIPGKKNLPGLSQMEKGILITPALSNLSILPEEEKEQAKPLEQHM